MFNLLCLTSVLLYLCNSSCFLRMELLGYRNLCLALVDIVKQFSKVLRFHLFCIVMNTFIFFLKSSYFGRYGALFYCYPF